jgi:hypothetical protein
MCLSKNMNTTNYEPALNAYKQKLISINANENNPSKAI